MLPSADGRTSGYCEPLQSSVGMAMRHLPRRKDR